MGSDTFVFSITTVNDLNGDGYLDNPFADLPNDGDTFTNEVTTDDETCNRAIIQVAFDGGVEGPDPVAVLQNPFDSNQTLVVSVPRTVISAPQRGVLVVAIACSLDALYEGDVDELTSDLPVEDLVAGNAFFEVSILVLDDPETQEPTDYREIDDPAPTPDVAKQGLGATVALTGLNFSPGLTPDFISHPTTAAATGEVTIEETVEETKHLRSASGTGFVDAGDVFCRSQRHGADRDGRRPVVGLRRHRNLRCRAGVDDYA